MNRPEVGETGRMVELVVDGTTVRYYPQGEPVPPEVTERVYRYSFRDDSLTMHHPRVRQIVVPLRPGDDLALLALHWDDGTDLDLLDHLVGQGADIDDAVARALTCEVREPICGNCDNASVVLVAARHLPGGGWEREARHEMTTVCPNCGDPGYVPHAEVLA